MEWLEVTVSAGGADVNILSEHLERLGMTGLVIEDEEDFTSFLENNRQYWDYVDDALVEERRGLSRVKFYLSADNEGQAALGDIRRAMPDWYSAHGVANIDVEVKLVRDEDWENNWKEFYKPIEIGSRLLVVPEWEEIPEANGRVVLRLDPGLTFGTGYHATTQMCLEALEEMELNNVRALDLGCGSGILSIAALLLGAKDVIACDIDPKAEDAAAMNSAMNGIGPDKLSVICGDVLTDSSLRRRLGNEKHPLVLANIVADVIIPLCSGLDELLAPGGTFVCSGIIDGRENEVRAAIESKGLTVTAHRHRDEWHSFTAVL